jgi:acyl-homoserine lactone acylase PvdQ
MTAVEILKLPAQNMAYADEYHVWSNVYIPRFEETKQSVSTGTWN